MTREEAIEFGNMWLQINEDCKDSSTYAFFHIAIEELKQEPKTGHWKSFTHSAYHGIDDDGETIWREFKVYHCSECYRKAVKKENYCPNCGVCMKDCRTLDEFIEDSKEQERSDKE